MRNAFSFTPDDFRRETDLKVDKLLCEQHADLVKFFPRGAAIYLKDGDKTFILIPGEDELTMDWEIVATSPHGFARCKNYRSVVLSLIHKWSEEGL